MRRHPASAIADVLDDIARVEANDADARDLTNVHELVAQQRLVLAVHVNAAADRDAVDAAHEERPQPPRKREADARAAVADRLQQFRWQRHLESAFMRKTVLAVL